MLGIPRLCLGMAGMAKSACNTESRRAHRRGGERTEAANVSLREDGSMFSAASPDLDKLNSEQRRAAGTALLWGDSMPFFISQAAST